MAILTELPDLHIAESRGCKPARGFSIADEPMFHALRKSCGVNWANHLPTHAPQAYVGHADIRTTWQYYLTVEEEHPKRTAWVIEQVTMLGGDKDDASVTPGPQNDSIRRVGLGVAAEITHARASTSNKKRAIGFEPTTSSLGSWQSTPLQRDSLSAIELWDRYWRFTGGSHPSENRRRPLGGRLVNIFPHSGQGTDFAQLRLVILGRTRSLPSPGFRAFERGT